MTDEKLYRLYVGEKGSALSTFILEQAEWSSRIDRLKALRDWYRSHGKEVRVQMMRFGIDFVVDLDQEVGRSS